MLWTWFLTGYVSMCTSTVYRISPTPLWGHPWGHTPWNQITLPWVGHKEPVAVLKGCWIWIAFLLYVPSKWTGYPVSVQGWPSEALAVAGKLELSNPATVGSYVLQHVHVQTKSGRSHDVASILQLVKSTKSILQRVMHLPLEDCWLPLWILWG